ncbi:MAG: EAL domain-containing protein, partial [Gammaproteobacteria bacterium]
RQPGLFQQVKNILKETGVEPHFLELEITEGTAMSCLESAIATTRQFQALGIRVSLDDFGTGFSSLNYLRLLPVDTLKIDRSFITDLVSDKDNLSIVAAIIAMSHKLGMTVLAEGVEYNNQYRLLQKLNCDEVQGYLVSMPIPPDEIETLLLSDFGFSVEEKVAALTH